MTLGHPLVLWESALTYNSRYSPNMSLRNVLLGIAVAPVGAAATAVASLLATLQATPVDPTGKVDPDIDALSRMFLSAAQTKNWQMLAALIVVGLVWGLRRFGGDFIPTLKTDRGGAALALAIGISGALVNALAVAAKPSLQLLVDGVTTGVMAAGGWAVVRKIFGVSAAQKADPAK